MISTGFKSSTEIYRYPPSLLPDNFSFDNFKQAWIATPWWRYLINTIIVATIVPILRIILSAFAGYALTFKFKGSKIIFFAMLGTMMIPEETTLIAKYIIIKNLGWINTYYALIVPMIASAFSIFLFRQFYLTLPQELQDAAAIDGCTNFRYMISIGIPLSKSVSITIGLLAFIDEWNSTLWPLIVINNDKLRLVQIALKAFSDDRGTTWNQLMAACCFVTIPVLILFIILQKQFIESVASTGIKA
jgi:multiple sugar transport system permease protein